MDSYNVVFLGYPNWWHTVPMAVFTFLEEYDFSGKTIIPFCTHGGGGLSTSERDIAKACPKAKHLRALSVYGSYGSSPKKEVANWLSKIAF